MRNAELLCIVNFTNYTKNALNRNGRPVPYIIPNSEFLIPHYFMTFILSIFISSVPVIEQPLSLE